MSLRVDGLVQAGYAERTVSEANTGRALLRRPTLERALKLKGVRFRCAVQLDPQQKKKNSGGQ